ncbi:WSC-domain-containing protein [Apiospora marii]|uniref:WSC-domain-containing protein n=1 Tax=Apiospora marii TaxID=335849 RepID=UPI0031308A08
MSENYTLLGCYLDQSPNRTLNTTAYQGSDLSDARECHAMCNVPQFKAAYFGLEYGTECYCGASDAALRFRPAADNAECDKPCPRNASEMCGSDWRLSIYQILDTSVKPSPSPDVMSTASVPPMPSSSTAPGGNNGTTPSPSSTPTEDQRTDDSGGSHLSGGEIAGIVVAVVFILALLAGLVILLMRRRQQRGQKRGRVARSGTGAAAGQRPGTGTTEAGTEGGASGVQMAGASGPTAGAGAGSGSNSREGGLGSGKAKAAGGPGNTASVDGDSLVAGAPYHHHPHNDELPGYQSSAR